MIGFIKEYIRISSGDKITFKILSMGRKFLWVCELEPSNDCWNTCIYMVRYFLAYIYYEPAR